MHAIVYTNFTGILHHNTIVFFFGHGLNIIFGWFVDVETFLSALEFNGVVIWMLSDKCIFHCRIVGYIVAQVNQMRKTKNIRDELGVEPCFAQTKDIACQINIVTSSIGSDV